MTEKIECQHEAKKLRLGNIQEIKKNLDREVTFQITLNCECGERIYFGSSYLLENTQ